MHDLKCRKPQNVASECSRHKTIFGRLDVATQKRSSLNMSNTIRHLESLPDWSRLQYKIHECSKSLSDVMWCRSAANGQLSASLAQLKVGVIRGGAWRVVGLGYDAKWCCENGMTVMNSHLHNHLFIVTSPHIIPTSPHLHIFTSSLSLSLSISLINGCIVFLGVCGRLEISWFGDEWGLTLSRAFQCDPFGSHRCHAISITSMGLHLV